MRKPNKKQSAWQLYAWGIEVCEGLDFFPETADLGTAFRPVVDEIKTFAEERPRLELALVPLRAKVRFADYSWDADLRSFSKTVEIADGGKRGRMHAAVFPNGITPFTAASGGGQVAPAQAFLDRLIASKAAGLEPLRVEWQPRLQAALENLEQAVAQRTQAYKEIADLSVRERAAKDDFDISVEKLMGQIRTIFPKDPARWNVIFPSQKSTASTVTPDESDTEDTE